MSKKAKLVSIATAAVIALAVGASAVYAQGPLPPDGDRQGMGFRGNGRGSGMRGPSLIQAAAEATGMAVTDIIAELQNGQTLAQVAESAGVDTQAIIDAFVTLHEANLEMLLENIEDRLEEPWEPRSPQGPRGRGNSLIETVVEVTGLERDDVLASLQDGLTLAQIAESAGVDTQVVIDAAVEQHAEALANAVEQGRMTQEQADELLENLAQHIAEQLEQEHPMPYGIQFDSQMGPMGGRRGGLGLR